MYITTSKQNLKSNQAIATSASKGLAISYPKLKTPYNEANTPEDVSFYFFGGEEDREKKIPEPVESKITLITRVTKADIQPLAEELGLDMTEHTSVNNCLKALETQGYYLVVTQEEKRESITKD